MPKMLTPYLSLKPESLTALLISLESGISKTSAIPISCTLSCSSDYPPAYSLTFYSLSDSLFSRAISATLSNAPKTYKMSFSFSSVSGPASF